MKPAAAAPAATPSASISTTLLARLTNATGLRSWMRTTSRSGQTRETDASSTQSIASKRRRRSSSGTERIPWPKSASKTCRTFHCEA